LGRSRRSRRKVKATEERKDAGEAHRQAGVGRVGRQPGRAHRRVGGIQGAPRLLVDDPADFGEDDPALGPHEQLGGDLGFELPDLGAEGRLRDGQRLGRPREAPLVRDLDEVAQLPQFHGRTFL
jgi:hypothetical protein